MAEPGFAWALYYQVTRQADCSQAGHRLGAWADATDLRQLALVFDWCGPAMTQAQSDYAWRPKSSGGNREYPPTMFAAKTRACSQPSP